MSVKAKIVSGDGTPWVAGVTVDQALKIESMPVRRAGISPSLVTSQKIYREYFTIAGTNTSDMNVLGSLSVPINFVIDSKPDRLLAVYGLRVLFESTNMDASGLELRRFGAANTVALPNGLLLSVSQGGIVTPLFLEPVTTVGDFFSYTETFLNRVDGVANNTDILNFKIDFDVPVILPADSIDAITFSVRDDLRLLLRFKTMVFGTQELIL